jgi:hypothetical protein
MENTENPEIIENSDVTEPPEVAETPEATETPEITQTPEATVKSTASDKVIKALIVASSVFLSLVLLVAVTGTAAGFIARTALSAESIQTITRTVVREMDLSEVYSIAVASSDNSGLNADEDATLAAAILDNIDDYYIETYDIDEDAIAEILENEALLEFAADIFAGLGEFLTGGLDGEELIITPDEVVDFIEENREDIEEITGYTFDESDFDDIREALTETLADVTWGAVMEEVMYEIPVDLDTIRGMVSVQMLIALLGAAALLTALIIFANRKSFRGLIYCGAAGVLAGTLLLFAQLAFGIVYSLAEEHLGLAEAQVSEALSGVRGTLVLTGVLVLIAGLLTIAAGIVVPIIKNRACKNMELVV